MIYEAIDPGYLKSKIDYLDLSITGLRDALRGAQSKDFTTVQTTLDTISSTVSGLLTESDFDSKWTSGIYGYDGTTPRRVLVDSSGRLEITGTVTTSISEVKVWDGTDYLGINADGSINVNNIDVAISTLLAESTFTGRWDGGIYGYDGTTARKIKTDANGELQVDVLSTANPSNLDVALSTRASDSTLSAFSSKFPDAGVLSDAVANPTTTIIGSALLGFDGTNWERIHTDGSNRLKVSLDSIPNPSNLDVALSTRLSEITFTGRFPAAQALSDALSNPTTTIIGGANLGFDGTNWRRLTALQKDIAGGNRNALTTIPSGSPMDITRMPYEVDDISVTTTESSTAISAPGAKYLLLVNKGDNDIEIGINNSVPVSNPMKVRARCLKIIPFAGATAVYYKTDTGTSTLSIGYLN